MVEKILPHAFVIESRSDSPMEKQKVGNGSFDADLVFRSCSYVDAEGWLIASVANLTFVNGVMNISYGDAPEYNKNFTFDLLHRVNCIEETEKSLFRIMASRKEWDTDPRDREINLSISAISRAFHSDSDYLGIKKIRTPEKNLECFFHNRTRVSFTTEITLRMSLTIYCHKRSRSDIQFYTIFLSFKRLVTKNLTFVYSNEADDFVHVEKRPIPVILEFWARLDVKGEVPMGFLDAKFIMERELNGAQLNIRRACLSPASCYEYFGAVSYSKAENTSVIVAGDSMVERTVLDKQTVIIGATELVLIIVFWLFMKIWFVLYAQDVQAPNTVDGLSETWSRSIFEKSECPQTPSVTLKLRRRNVGGIEMCTYEPETAKHSA
ncbi:hypothetical protein FGB62_124g07 [Gracilaria domingensis]|nr:hypothetical protein FGB62_124g07 [Gracilaria domingensis]